MTVYSALKLTLLRPSALTSSLKLVPHSKANQVQWPRKLWRIIGRVLRIARNIILVGVSTIVAIFTLAIALIIYYALTYPYFSADDHDSFRPLESFVFANIKTKILASLAAPIATVFLSLVGKGSSVAAPGGTAKWLAVLALNVCWNHSVVRAGAFPKSSLVIAKPAVTKPSARMHWQNFSRNPLVFERRTYL